MTEPQPIQSSSPLPGTDAMPPGDGPTALKLFLLFLKVGLTSFGGGTSGWLYNEFVLRRHWMSDEEFASNHAFAQMMPGPSVANLTICCAATYLRWPGVLASLLALFIGPFFCVLALMKGFHYLSTFPWFGFASDGIVSAALSLLLVVGIRGVRRQFRKFPPGLAVIAVTVFTIGVLHWPMIPVALTMAVVSIALAWRRA